MMLFGHNAQVVVKTLLVFHHLFRIELPPFNPDEEKQSLLQRMLPRTQSPFNMAKFKQSAAVGMSDHNFTSP